ncbi:LAMI_0F06150g1_1 [Lachancea mirantina]|uniref:Ribonuclease P/MRP protein subunit POP5 n=1 Tax=Lachancea mirantina TaxID=1230905 RepID=A0A1G4JYT0_9SACH|nr:LAMI_0F06150g1_1 [Lachancea mirantina]
MVRLKSRYILFEVLHPEDVVKDTSIDDDGSNPQNFMLRLHRISPANINAKSIILALRKALQSNFGDFGCANGTNVMQLKYFSNRTSTGILRCSREHYDLILISMTLMSKIDTTEGIIVNPIKISGTIKKLELYGMRRSKIIGNKLNCKLEDNFQSITEDQLEE